MKTLPQNPKTRGLGFVAEIAKKINSGEISPSDLWKYVLQFNGFGGKTKHERVDEYIYIVRMGQWHKIGRTKNLKQRVGVYLRENKKAELIFSKKFEDSVLAERMLLSIFPEKKVGNTEWFAFEQKDVDTVIKEAKKL